MAPLVPEIIGNEFNFVIALLIGVAFGYTLEQAGFSSTKKLVGLFYGYDFTVLRVFFTAGVTAMIGVLLLAHFGLLDIRLIYVNPTFLWSALVGGAIMGAGFIIGGFCPGTSVCAASIGKLDGWAFIFGSLIGILAFAEFYPILEPIYLGKAMGPVRIDVFFGLSPVAWAFILTAIAILAFYGTTWVEYRVRKKQLKFSPLTMRRTYLVSVVPFVFILLAVVIPSRNDRIQKQVADKKEQGKCVFKEISADKLADELVNNYYKVNLIDVRTKEEFESGHLPLAINIPLSEFLDRKYEDYFKQKHKTNIFYSNDSATHKEACLTAQFVGKSNNLILKETADDFERIIFHAQKPEPLAGKEAYEEYLFRSGAARKLTELQTAFENLNKPVIKEVIKATGGCS
ncbi:hypothetical protein SAMN05444285_10730 [Draconibacterium orientale]|uniref:Sulfurtransferase n=1 Tax=Draconibacterium orientale TaxID=1168034 RepID=X5DZQ0_9BACT|nr:YeeE/YedE thiosulfate transporter family protein [Draconibacterium orientale]AHW59771.1 sulfurtransferase [Draconibacterium orientale]SET16212.1 hypothetical protein SAMN05444285_10730 [Draconibacterium orientale]